MTASTSRSAGTALAISSLSLAVCFAAAWWSRDLALFSLTPPGGGAADVAEALRQDLHLTFFTIWASLLLATPALALFPTIRQSARAFEAWRILWTASLLVFAVHFYWATVVIFGNDWQRILNTPRVSAPRLDTVFALWWVLDVVLAWTTRTNAFWLRLQRLGVHLLAFVLFFMGAAREGELAASRALGWSMAVVVAAGLVSWLVRRRRSKI